MWSDECSVKRGGGKKQEWAFRTPAQKWQKDMVTMYNKGKLLSAMVWGCFWGHGRSDLYILDRDFESKKHGYSAWSYIKVLNDQLKRCWQPSLVFMQDNAAIHTARSVKQWFEDEAIILINWPPCSPDLNPIEHVWFRLKEKVLELYPELLNAYGRSEQDLELLERALQEAWNALPDELFDSLWKSMPARVAACIAAEGWYIKY